MMQTCCENEPFLPRVCSSSYMLHVLQLMMWCLLGQLPRAMWTVHILPLLSLRDSSRLDCSVCSKRARAELLAMIEDHSIQVHDGTVKGGMRALIQWISFRRLKVETITITRNHCVALKSIDEQLSLTEVGNISLSYPAITEDMNNGLVVVSDNTLSRVKSLYFGPFSPLDISTAHVPKDMIVAETILYMPKLTHLTVTLNAELGDKLCLVLALRGGLLREVSIHAYAVPDAEVVVETVAGACPLLRSFMLEYHLTNNTVALDSLQSLLSECPRLQELFISPPTGEDLLASAAQLLNASTNFTTLHCSKLILDRAALSAWATHGTNLTSVGLTWQLYQADIDERAGDALAHVRDLTASNLADEDALRGLQEALHYTTRLQALTVTLDRIEAPGLPLSLVTQLAASCTHLVSVALHNGAGLDDGDAVDAAFAVLAEHNPHLQALLMHPCVYIGDQTVGAIAKHCPRFRSLEVYPELRVSDAGLVALVRACLHLTRITTGASSVTDAGLLAVAENGAPFLESLRLQTSSPVSERTKAMLKEGCPKLRNLNLQVWSGLWKGD
jgi:hypothetical protein